MALLRDTCGCDRCGKSVKKSEGALNKRSFRLYCRECWQHMKSLDPAGEELPLGETWEEAVERTDSSWL